MKIDKTTDNILFVIPPFTLLESPSVGVHSVQRVAVDNGFNVNVLYADQIFAKYIGIDKYKIITNELMSPYEQIPERLFAHLAYSKIPYMGKRTDENGITYKSYRSDKNLTNIQWSDLLNLKTIIELWLDDLIENILYQQPTIVGLTSSHQQTNAAIAIINKIKKLSPSIITIIGGSNCDGRMSMGIKSLSGNIDYIFSGESEYSFLDFLQNLENGILPKDKIIHGVKVAKLNDLPAPEFDEYYQQLQINNLLTNDTWITYESSRGCWWGQSNLCTFCGVNGNEPQYRAKEPSKVFEEISKYLKKHPSNNVRMVDVLMPRNYLRTLIPDIANYIPNISIFYEQRADMSLSEMISLKSAGVDYMQIGIESFSNSQLNRLKKGTTVKDNLNTLRYAKSLDIVVGWNMLTEIPDDTKDDWFKILKILPYIRHLNPPIFFRPIEITRFSPYLNSPSNFNITNIKPFEVYYDIFPSEAAIYELAWLFSGDYKCHSREDKNFQSLIIKEVDFWIQLWDSQIESIPCLELHKYDSNKFLIRDTRSISTNNKITLANEMQASVVLLGEESSHFARYKSWAIENKYLLDVDNEYLAIATSTPYILTEFTKE